VGGRLGAAAASWFNAMHARVAMIRRRSQYLNNEQAQELDDARTLGTHAHLIYVEETSWITRRYRR
jgi:hypothetical protein